MNTKGLKHNKDVKSPSPFQIRSKEYFIYRHGITNCRMLKFKDVNTVIKIMDNYDVGCLTKKDKQFILENSNKEVLVCLCHPHQQYPDIFVYGDDNIAFRVACFI